MRSPGAALVPLLFLASISCSLAAQNSAWQMESSGTTANLRGIHTAGGGVVWASGDHGTVLRTEDSGYMWQSCAMPPGAEKLDFRAIWAWDANTAVVMSSGPGSLSRLYKTIDGCSHWTLLFTNPEPGGFYDGLVFLDQQRGFVIGDATESDPKVAPVEGGYYALRIRATADAGQTWVPVVAPVLPPNKAGIALYAFPDEGFFAASNSSAVDAGGFLSLATNQGRILRKPDSAASFQAALCAGAMDPYSSSCGIPWDDWTSVSTPLAGGGKTSGIFSVAFRNAQQGLIVGGDYAKPKERKGTAAWSRDSGAHWTLSSVPPGGYRSSVSWEPGEKLWITVGPNGSDLSRDNGKSWQPIEHAPANIGKGGEWNALSLPWVVGPNGRIAKLNEEALPSAPK